MSYECAIARFENTTTAAMLAKPLPVDGYIALDEYEGPGSTIRWGSWEHGRRPLAPEQSIPITLFPSASGSDYSGSTVEASNYRVLCEDEHVMARSVLVRGDHGTFGIAYIGQPTRRIRAILDALDRYPLLDEDDHIELETEIENEQWASWGREDFRRDLAHALDKDLDETPDRALNDLWWKFTEHHGDSGRKFEAPDSCHFYITEAIEWFRDRGRRGGYQWLVEAGLADKLERPEVIVLFDLANGALAPLRFQREIDRSRVLGVDENTWLALKDADACWDAWDDVMRDAVLVEKCDDDALSIARDADIEGRRDARDKILADVGATLYHLDQNDDVILMVPHGMEWCDRTNEWIWTSDTEETEAA